MQRTASGALAGVLAGAILAVVAVSYTMLSGQGFWAPAIWLAGVVQEQGNGDMLAILIALCLHLTISAGFGVIFVHLHALLAPASPGLLAGLLFGILVYALDRFVLEPLLAAPSLLPVTVGLFAHLLYGGMLGALTSSSQAQSSG
ncbi:MAG: hypothetical protein KGM44_08955 [bacterium]|nr:hypothetical protein [bacterium]